MVWRFRNPPGDAQTKIEEQTTQKYGIHQVSLYQSLISILMSGYKLTEYRCKVKTCNFKIKVRERLTSYVDPSV